MIQQVYCDEHGLMKYYPETFWWQCQAPGCQVMIVYKEDALLGPDPRSGAGWHTRNFPEAPADPFPDLVPPSELAWFLMHEKQLITLDGRVLWHAAEPQGVPFEWVPPAQITVPLVLRARHLPGGRWFALSYFPEGHPGPQYSDGIPPDGPEGLAEAIRKLEGWQGGETEFVSLALADREELGQVVREAWVRWAHSQPRPKKSWLTPWEELGEADREADRQIGEAVRDYLAGL